MRVLTIMIVMNRIIIIRMIMIRMTMMMVMNTRAAGGLRWAEPQYKD